MRSIDMKSTRVTLLSVAVAAGFCCAAALPVEAQGGPTPRPVAVLLCQYADKPNTYGFTASGILGNTWLPNNIAMNGQQVDNSISGLVQDASLGQINFQGSQAFGWYKLPNPLASYPVSSDAGDACIAVAQQNGVNMTPFSYVAVYMNDVLNDAMGESWTAKLPGTAAPTLWNALIVGVRGLTSPPLVLHELGHILSNGGAHTNSYSDPLGGASYLGGDPSKPNVDLSTLRVATVSPEWDASRRELMGFIPAGSIVSFTGGTQTYNISRLTQPLNGLPTVIEVPLPDGTKYVISARTNIGYDSYLTYPNQAFLGPSLSTQGVRIELYAGLQTDAVLEMSNPAGDPTGTDGVWLTGQTYTDAANNITINVVNFNAGGNPTAQITVTGPTK